MKNYLGYIIAILTVFLLSFNTVKDDININTNNESICVSCNNSAMVSVAGNDPNKVHHIMQSKHAWNKVYANPTWSKVSKDILSVLNNGAKFKYKSNTGVYRKTYLVKGFSVDVIFYEASSGACKLTDAWVRTN